MAAGALTLLRRSRARAARVHEVLPGFDGSQLDNLIDFHTYTSMPLLLVWRAGLLPGALGSEESGIVESFSAELQGGLEYPHYTRPAEFRGHEVPEVLRSGDHGAIARWRLQQQQQRTQARRPDLYARWQAGQAPGT